ncbi:M56 family metallopeptidase [Neobacillus cucumis]|nr:M56 family metallopeptidase [Neobacillus cucumis]
MWHKKSWYLIGTSVLVAFLVWSQMGMYLVHLFFGVKIQANFFKFCISLFKENTFYYFMVIFLLNVLIAYSFLISIISFIEQYILSKRFIRKLKLHMNKELTNEVIKRFKNKDLIVINNKEALAFTLGISKPLIVLSTGLIEMLELDELEAVIKHETFHQKNRDPLKLFILRVITGSLWFIPLTKWSYKNYKIISELSADEYAINKTGSELGLSSALFKLINNCMNKTSAPILVHFSDESINFRLQHLLEPKKSIPLKLETKSLIISIYVLAVLIGFIQVTVT